LPSSFVAAQFHNKSVSHCFTYIGGLVGFFDFGGPEGGPLGGLEEGFDGGAVGGPLGGLEEGFDGGAVGGPLGGLEEGFDGGAGGGPVGELVGGAVGGPLGGPDGGALLIFSSVKAVLWAETGKGGGVAAVFGLACSSAAGARFFENDKMSVLGATSWATGGASTAGFGVKGADSMSEDFSHGGVLAASSRGASAASPTEIAVEMLLKHP
jgi:hypothetical protein